MVFNVSVVGVMRVGRNGQTFNGTLLSTFPYIKAAPCATDENGTIYYSEKGYITKFNMDGI